MVVAAVVGVLLVAWGALATAIAVREHNDEVALQLDHNDTLEDLDETSVELSTTAEELEKTTAERDKL